MKRSYDVRAVESRAGRDSCRSYKQDKLGIKMRLALVSQGAVGAFIATGVCCLLPAVAIATGLTGSLTATLVSLGRFSFYGILAGLVFVAISS